MNTVHGGPPEGVGLGTKKTKLPVDIHHTVLLLCLFCGDSVQSASVTIISRAWHWWALEWREDRVQSKPELRSGPAKQYLWQGGGREVRSPKPGMRDL